MRDLLLGGFIGILAAAPASSNYILKNYDVGSGGSGGSSSSNYRLNGVSGTQTGETQSSTNYTLPSGNNNAQNASVPAAPTFTNPSNYYNRLQLVLNPGGNPSDTKYLIAISTDNFTTTRYVQPDNTIGNTASVSTYQTYAVWGGSTGVTITGLTPSTTYRVKVKAMQGSFTDSAYSPVATAATVATSLSISLTTTATSTPPFPVNFTSLTPGSVVNGSADAVIGITSNALGGGDVYIRSTNAALASNLASTSITSATTDLSSAATGYGAQVTAASQTSGGPLASVAPFNGASNNVGGLTTSLQKILSTTTPINGGSATIRLKAKASAITPSSTDYTDQLTLIAAMNF